MPQQILFPMNPLSAGPIDPIQTLIINTVKSLVPQIISSIQASQQQISVAQQPINQPQPPVVPHREMAASAPPANQNLSNPVSRESDVIRRGHNYFERLESDRVSSSMRGELRGNFSESGDHRIFFTQSAENRAQAEPHSSGPRYHLSPPDSQDVVGSARYHNWHGDRDSERSDIRRVRDWDESREEDRFISRRPRHSESSSMMPDRRFVEEANQDTRRNHGAPINRRDYENADVRGGRHTELSQRSRDIPTNGPRMENVDMRRPQDPDSSPIPRENDSQGTLIA